MHRTGTTWRSLHPANIVISSAYTSLIWASAPLIYVSKPPMQFSYLSSPKNFHQASYCLLHLF